MDRQLQLENATGTYYCDGDGKLLFLEPRRDNCLYRGPFGPHRLETERSGMICAACRVKDLIIPEGIRCIGNEDPYAVSKEVTLRDTIVAGKLRFPSTLEILRENVLSGSLIMDMELPKTVRHIGSGAIELLYPSAAPGQGAAGAGGWMVLGKDKERQLAAGCGGQAGLRRPAVQGDHHRHAHRPGGVSL